MVIDAGPQGIGRCGHGHADALSLRLTMNGSRWLVDSGSGVYISADPADRNAFRGTAAHNTLRVDGMDQAVADEPFSWTDIPTTRGELDNWKTFTYFRGSHNGYERLADPVTHRRSRSAVDDAAHLAGARCRRRQREHDLELNWHFASDLVQQAGASEFDCIQARARACIAPDPARADTLEGNHHRAADFSRVWRYQPAPVVRYEARVKLPAEIATTLVAEAATRTGTRAAGASMVSAQLVRRTGGGAGLRTPRSRRATHFFARGKQPWSFGPGPRTLKCFIAGLRMRSSPS